MQLKTGVKTLGVKPELLFALMAAEGVYNIFKVPLVVTALTDGTHHPGSLHYAGLAADLRSSGFDPAAVPKVVAEIKTALGSDYDVVVESDHIHLEFQPKTPFS